MQRVRQLWRVSLLIFALNAPAHAWDLHNKPFGFRLQITEDPPFGYSAFAGLVSENGSFATGGGVTINSAIALIRLPGDSGTITPLFTRSDVYDSTTRQGQDFDLRTNAFTLRYS